MEVLGRGSDADAAGGWSAARAQAAAAAAAAAGAMQPVRGGRSGGTSTSSSPAPPSRAPRRSLSDSSSSTARYSGRVLVRGMFRRVWRPRFLELVDDGILRYYETAVPVRTSTTSSSQDDASTVGSASEGPPTTPTTRPTATTAAGARTNEEVVLGGAAVIDADWVRTANNNSNSNNSGRGGGPATPAEGWCYVADSAPGSSARVTAAAHSPTVVGERSSSRRPKSVLLVLTARVIDAHSIRDMHIGLPRGSYGFCFRAHPRKQHVPSAGVEPDHVARDYLCAVNSPEEAHEWVTALKWAASLRPSPRVTTPTPPTRPLPPTAAPRTPRPMTPTTPVPTSAAAARVTTVEEERPSPPHLRRRVNAGGEEEEEEGEEDVGFLSPTVADIPTSVIARSPPAPPPPPTPTTARASPNLGPSDVEDDDDVDGVTVVTKVSRHRICRLTSSSSSSSNLVWPWLPFLSSSSSSFGGNFKVVYEVRMLLLRSDQLAPPEDEKATTVTPLSIEERTVYRTFADFVHLIHALLEELFSSHAAGVVLDRSQRKQLSLIRKALQELQMVGRGSKTAVPLVPRHRRILSADSFGSSCSSPAATATLAEWHALRDAAKRACRSEESLMRESQPDAVARVDAVLRRLTTHAHVCNATATRKFLNMLPSQRQSTVGKSKLENVIGFMVLPQEDLLSTTLKSTLRVSPGHGTDDFVRRWITAPTGAAPNADVWRVRLAVLLQSHHFATLVSCLVLWGVSRLAAWWWSTWCCVVVEVRVDVLLLAMACAFVLGRESVSVAKKKQRAKKRRSLPKAHDASQSSLAAPTTAEALAAGDRLQATTAPEEEEEEVMEDSEDDEEEEEGCFRSADAAAAALAPPGVLPSPLPLYPANGGQSAWSRPPSDKFRVRSATYFQDRVKMPSATQIFECRGVDVWLTDNPASHIARHPSVLGGKVKETDTFCVNFLLPFCNLVACFAVPPLEDFPPTVRRVWQKFLAGNQQYRDERLKLLPVVVDGPWIVRKAVGPGTSPALLGKVVPLQYYFTPACGEKKAVYEVDIIISASRIAKGILSVVKGHTKCLTIAFALIVEASEQEDLPETVLASFGIHELHLEQCPHLPELDLDGVE